ncbi:MAG: DUF4281 domain-containing protein [Rhodothermales bacterium]|nr:DUF4281 domain-containing protein [Rhodothermales bacterium]MBO6780316.1 DUF4281 domain-containing protein [Rhodothermales bacterium]
MSPDAAFSMAGTLVMPCWLLLIFAPRWSWTTRLITTVAVPALLAVAYIYFLASGFGETDGGFGSLDEVATLFSDPRNLLAGWLHYLAFDLLVGSWIVRDAARVGVNHLLIVPCLVLCFLAGPVGYLLYLLLRAGIKRQILMDPMPKKG